MSSCLLRLYPLRRLGSFPPSWSLLTPQVLCPVVLTTSYMLMTFQFISLAWTSLLNSNLIAPATHLRAPLGGILDTSLFDTPYPNRQQTLLLLLSKQCLVSSIFSPPPLLSPGSASPDRSPRFPPCPTTLYSFTPVRRIL